MIDPTCTLKVQNGTNVRASSTLPRTTDGVERPVMISHKRTKPRKGKPRHRNAA